MLGDAKNAAECILDCVVMDSRGLSDVKAIYLGRDSHKVLNKAPCTCIAVK